MKCPYAFTCETIRQWHSDRDDDGFETDGTLAETNTVKFVNCIAEECGAYYDGKCHYKT